MKNMKVLVALSLTFLMLIGPTTVHAGTYISDPVSPDISNSLEQEELLEAEVPSTSEGTEEAALEDQPAETPILEAVVMAESGSVNIRAAASKDSEIIGKLASGMSVIVLGTEGDWMLVRADGVTGYVHSNYLNIGSLETGEIEEPTEEEIDISSLKVEIFSSLGDQVSMGETIQLTSLLTGFEGIEHALQWQYNDGSGWKDVVGATEGSYEFKATKESVQYSWRLAVTI